MPKLSVDITVEEALSGLEHLAVRRAVVSYKDLDRSDSFDADALVSSDDCIDVAIDKGYIDADDALDGLDPEVRDLQDGLRALLDGNRQMANTLLSRGLASWPDAARAVEDILLGRTHHDRRQATLALAA